MGRATHLWGKPTNAEHKQLQVVETWTLPQTKESGPEGPLLLVESSAIRGLLVGRQFEVCGPQESFGFSLTHWWGLNVARNRPLSVCAAHDVDPWCRSADEQWFLLCGPDKTVSR